MKSVRRKLQRGEAGVAKEPGAVYTVRDAKARFSEVIRLASQGTDVIVTSHDTPKVRISAVENGDRVFRVARRWLRSMPVAGPQTPAERIIREDRDSRG